MNRLDRLRGRTFGALLVVAAALPVDAQTVPPRQAEAHAYTRYELLVPGSATFRIVYDVTATTAGATHYFKPIRAGHIATGEQVSDRATGKPLVFDVVGAAVARTGGEARVLIDKTYEDAKSYFMDGTTLVFNRPLGIKRNAVVLPKGYELASCNYPSQILQEADGPIAITAAKLDRGEPVTPATEVVVFRFAPVAPGATTRVQMSETYPDSAIPTEVSALPNGRFRLDFINPRPDELAALITAHRRPVSPR